MASNSMTRIILKLMRIARIISFVTLLIIGGRIAMYTGLVIVKAHSDLRPDPVEVQRIQDEIYQANYYILSLGLQYETSTWSNYANLMPTWVIILAVLAVATILYVDWAPWPNYKHPEVGNVKVMVQIVPGLNTRPVATATFREKNKASSLRAHNSCE